MTEHRDRIADALRKTQSADPPPGLDRRIKDEIPGVIDASAEQSRTPLWSLAAALVLLILGGWFAVEILTRGASSPAARVAEERSRASSDEVMREAPPPSVADERESGIRQESEESFASAPSLADRSSRPAKEETPEAQASGHQMAGVAETDRPDSEPEIPSEEQLASIDSAVDALTNTPVARPMPPAEPAREPRMTEMLTQAEPTEQSARSRDQKTVAAPSPAAAGLMESRAGAARADADEEAERAGQPLDWRALRELILDGELPPPAQIDVDRVVSHFDYGDRPPWRRGRISLFMEGGAAPLSPSRWRTIRVGMKSRDSADPVGTDAELEIRFDPETVSLYREIGNGDRVRTDRKPVVTEEIGTIPGDYSASRLFEVKLLPDVDLDQVVAAAVLRYTAEGKTEEIDKYVRVGHVAPTWKTTSKSLQLATLAGAFGEYLRGHYLPRTGVDLTYLANNLSADREGDPEAAELVEVVRRSVDLRLRR